MVINTVSKENAKEKALVRLYELLKLQKEIEKQFGIFKRREVSDNE